MVDGVHITVAHVDTDGLQGEAVLLARTVDEYRRSEAREAQGEVSVRRGISG